ncbi:hypothetical protein ACH54_09945, partial [Salmonella enterica subsp. enterica serovar Infantis]
VPRLSCGDNPNCCFAIESCCTETSVNLPLFASASGNVNAPALQMQLMLVQTGEIIWSGKGAVQQQ